MGMREWYWGSGKSSKRGQGGGGGGGGGVDKDITSTAGCMCAVFQLFDFHQLQLANLQQRQHQPEDLTVPKGVEAPRNSLDSSDGTTLSSTTKEEENLNSPILKFQMGMQIKTSTTKGRTSSSTDLSSDNSPAATKTPSLVARLMGLDLLPDQTPSPSSTSSSSHRISRSKNVQKKPLQSSTPNGGGGTRSLPETPRVSSARRSDVDHHHRLSLQINKENVGVGEDLEFSRCSSYKRRDLKLKIHHHIGDQENNVKSPSTYARQIVKQVKESVSRKVGLDITNTTRPANKSDNKQSRDELLQHLKSKNSNNVLSKGIIKEEVLVSKPKSPLSSLAARPKQPLQLMKEEQQVKTSERRINGRLVPTPKNQTASIPKRRPKSAHDIGYGPWLVVKTKQQEEAFVTSPSTADKKCKKTQILLLSSNNVPTLLPIKKDPSPPATKLPQKQAQQVSSDAQQSKRRWSQTLSSSTSQTYKQHQQLASLTPHVLATTATTAAGGEETEVHRYVTRILCRTGIDQCTPVSFAKWFSPSHPLDPCIFYRLENSDLTADHCSSELGQQCNRKLLFHAVDEILVQVLRPYMNLKPWVTTSSYSGRPHCFNGSQLINIVCHKIQKFPGADCQVLEDIDALIETDMPESKKIQSDVPFEEEGEGIVREVEEDILDTLIHETAMVLWF